MKIAGDGIQFLDFGFVLGVDAIEFFVNGMQLFVGAL